MRPERTDFEQSFLNAFWTSRRWGEAGVPSTKDAISEAISTLHCEPDIGMMMFIKIEDHYLHLYSEKLRRESKSK